MTDFITGQRIVKLLEDLLAAVQKKKEQKVIHLDEGRGAERSNFFDVPGSIGSLKEHLDGGWRLVWKEDFAEGRTTVILER